MSTQAHYKFWPKRLPHAITLPETSLWDNLETSARRYPHKTALVFFGRVFTYHEVLQKAERLAACLYGLGVRKGDRVVLSMQNCPQLVIAHFAILRANAVVVPVNPMNRAEELRHYITDPGAKVAITTSDLASELVRASDSLAAPARLDHLVVTHFTDAFDAQVTGDDAPPDLWRDWLMPRHALPALQGGRPFGELLGLAGLESEDDHPRRPAQLLAVVPAQAQAHGLGGERERTGGVGEVRDREVQSGKPNGVSCSFR